LLCRYATQHRAYSVTCLSFGRWFWNTVLKMTHNSLQFIQQSIFSLKQNERFPWDLIIRFGATFEHVHIPLLVTSCWEYHL
jgi:hypothetical protein